MFIFNKKGDFVAVVFLFRRRKYHSKRAWDLKKGGMETSTYSEFYLPFHVFS